MKFLLAAASIVVGGLVWGVAVPYVFKYAERKEAENRALEQTRSQWPTVIGTVISPGMEIRDLDDARIVTVEFHYRVRSIGYRGVQGWSRQWSNPPARQSESNYPQGKTVPIHYNPANTEEAFVLPENSTESWGGLFAAYLIAAGIYPLGFGVWLLRKEIRQRTATNAANVHA